MCREFYEHLRDWIIETEFDRYRSGRVFEYMWAVMFGAPPVSEPIEECDLLTCTDEVCIAKTIIPGTVIAAVPQSQPGTYIIAAVCFAESCHNDDEIIKAGDCDCRIEHCWHAGAYVTKVLHTLV